MAAAAGGGGIGTVSVHGGSDPDQWKCKAMWPPIISSTTYKQSVIESRLEEQDSISGQYTYSRSNNPTRECLEKSLACLEGAEYGFVTNSGSTATVVTLQSLLRPGDNILTAENVYFGSNILMEKLFSDYKITTTFFNVLKADDKALESAITGNTKLIWVDTPCNPTIELFDIQKLSAVAHKKDCLLVVDSTFATPYFIRPLSLGADVVIHSATKFLNGHGDVLMGVICTNSATISGSIRTLLTSTGTIPSPFDCYLANRGLHTLHVRMRAHAENALAVAHYLESSPFVDSVSYPGLPSHPQHELAKKMFSNNGFGSMVSFKIKGDLETAKKFLTNLKVFTMAVSLGSLESLAEVCTIMTRKAMKREDKLRIGITDNMIRLSVGLEDIDDLLDDLKQALQRCGQPHAIKMRPLTEEETKAVLEKLSKYIGDNVKLLVDRPDGSYVFRLQKSRVFYVKEQIMRWATNVARKQMLSLGTCIGKFTHGGKFHLVITGLDILAPHAKHKVWLKANSEQQFLYGHNVLKGGLGRITENTPMYQGVLVYSMNDTPLGFGVAAKSTQDCRHVDPGTTVIFNQADIGQYLRSEDQLS